MRLETLDNDQGDILKLHNKGNLKIKLVAQDSTTISSFLASNLGLPARKLFTEMPTMFLQLFESS